MRITPDRRWIIKHSSDRTRPRPHFLVTWAIIIIALCALVGLMFLLEILHDLLRTVLGG